MNHDDFHIAILSRFAEAMDWDTMYECMDVDSVPLRSWNVENSTTEAEFIQNLSNWSVVCFEIPLLPTYARALLGDRFFEPQQVQYTKEGRRRLLCVYNVIDGWKLRYDYKLSQIRIDYQAMYTVTDVDKGCKEVSLADSVRF